MESQWKKVQKLNCFPSSSTKWEHGKQTLIIGKYVTCTIIQHVIYYISSHQNLYLTNMRVYPQFSTLHNVLHGVWPLHECTQTCNRGKLFNNMFCTILFNLTIPLLWCTKGNWKVFNAIFSYKSINISTFWCRKSKQMFCTIFNIFAYLSLM